MRINLNTDHVVTLCKKYHVRTMSIFGSTARGDDTNDSDVDLLVSFSRPISLLQLVALERELSSVLGSKVEISTRASLSPYLRKQIIKECQLVYAA